MVVITGGDGGADAGDQGVADAVGSRCFRVLGGERRRGGRSGVKRGQSGEDPLPVLQLTGCRIDHDQVSPYPKGCIRWRAGPGWVLRNRKL